MKPRTDPTPAPAASVAIDRLPPRLPAVRASSCIWVLFGGMCSAEVTDAAMAVGSECLMLNKGPFVAEVVGATDNILRRMEQHKYRKRSPYRRLHVQLPTPTAP